MPAHPSDFNVSALRAQFPALNQRVNGQAPVYFDNPGGTQVSQSVIDAMRRYLIEANSNTHGAFHTSRLTDETIAEGRAAMADFLNAPSAQQIVFGPNMTTLTFQMSRAIGQTLTAGDEIVVTRMDHDANISPWLLMAHDRGIEVKWTNFDVETGRLDLEHMGSLIGPGTKLVACVYASNALGTINDIATVVDMAHGVGAYAYIDAVQYAPHGPTDVTALDVDFLVCSAYKFFGPHVGVLYGKREHLETLPAYKVRPASDAAPDRWETGTMNHEGIAGVAAAVNYLAGIGEEYGDDFVAAAQDLTGRRANLRRAMLAIKRYEQTLSRAVLDGLETIPGISIRGITERDSLVDRVPTVIFAVDGQTPEAVARALGEAGIYVWDGNYYALAVMERLGYEESGGLVRVGPVHYNTHEEVNRFLTELEHIAAR